MPPTSSQYDSKEPTVSGHQLQPLHLLTWDLATPSGQSVEQAQRWEGGMCMECVSQALAAIREYTRWHIQQSIQYNFPVLILCNIQSGLSYNKESNTF